MSTINKIKRDIKEDIKKIEESLGSQNLETLKETHIYIDGKYQNKINQWGMSQYGWSPTHGFIVGNIGEASIRDNLLRMKSKLEGYLQDIDLKPIETNNHSSNINFYNSNENNMVNNNTVINFVDIENELKENESLTDEETKDALAKLKELQKIYESKDSRKTKWEKAKKILIWLADKSVDVAIAYFPIIVSILKK